MIINTLADADYLIDRINNADIVAIDTETISVEDKTLVAFSIAVDEQTRFVIPCAMNHIKNLPRFKYKEIINAATKREGTVYHNFSFDGQVLFPFNPTIDTYNPHDTMVIAQLVDENIRHGLKSLSKRYLHYHQLSYKDVCGSGKKAITFQDVTDEELAEKYAGDDAVCTLRLFKYLYRLLQRMPEVLDCYETIERPLLNVVLNMHLVGVPIDKNKVISVGKYCKVKVNKYSKLLDDTMPGVNINSPKQLRDFFITKKKMPALKVTPSGEPSMDKEVLKKYTEFCDEAQYILDYRKYNKLLTTFIPAMTPNDDGRIYPSSRKWNYD